MSATPPSQIISPEKAKQVQTKLEWNMKRKREIEQKSTQFLGRLGPIRGNSSKIPQLSLHQKECIRDKENED